MMRKSVCSAFIFCVAFLLGAVAFGAQVHLAWDPSSGQVDGYRIYYGTTPGSHPTRVEVGNVTDYLVTGLQDATTYYFVVRAYNQYGESGDSNEVSWYSGDASGTARTVTFGNASGADYPNTVQDTFLNINNDVNATKQTLNTYTWPTDRVANAIVMKWDLSPLPADAEVQSAILYLYLESSGGDDQYEVSVHKIINYDPNIAQCNGYTYDGTNGWTPNTQCYNNVPLAQADIAQAEDTKVIDKNLGYKAWNVTQMVRDWVSDPSNNYGLLLNSDKTASADSFRFFASTEDTDGSKRPKLVITYTSNLEPDTTPPGDVTNASITPGTGQLTLSWTNPTDSDLAGVMIRYRTDGTYPQNATDGQPVPNGNNGRIPGSPGESMSYTHNNLDPTLHYYYAIFTYDNAGNYSHTVFLDAQPLPPDSGNQAPSASIAASPTSGESPLTVSFSGSGSDSDGTVASYLWNFGDGTTSTSQNPTHTYQRVSSDTQYTVTLTVTDNDGATGQATTTITVNPDSTPPSPPSGITVE